VIVPGVVLLALVVNVLAVIEWTNERMIK